MLNFSRRNELKSFQMPHVRHLVATALVVATLAGCVGSAETVVITDRPDPPPVVEAPPPPQPVVSPLDTVRARRFDQGKMWTFDNPPLQYFADAYGFRPDEEWFEHARLGALRFATYCSASFVSPHGLVVTNHHCARESITAVARDDEDLLENGFHAASLEEERRVDDLFVEQLVAISEITDTVYAQLEGVSNAARRAQIVRQTITSIEEERTGDAQARDSLLRVEVIELYEGGQYSAYTFRRYEDVRLVLAPELAVAYFGGNPDNFTYPRYSLDFSFFRVYGPDEEPITSENYFRWSTEGADEDDLVFVVGNPGSTSRLATVSQLIFERDYSLPQRLATLRSRAAILEGYIDENPGAAEEYGLVNVLFSLDNSIKATAGQLRGLRNPYLIARRRAAQEDFREDLAERDSLQLLYGDVFDEIAALQTAREAPADQLEAFTGFGSPSLSSHIMVRAFYVYLYSVASQRPGMPSQQLENIREEAMAVEEWPASLEEEFIAARLRDLQASLGALDPTVEALLGERTPGEVAEEIVNETALTDSAGTAELLEAGYLESDDPTVPLIEALAPLYLTMSRRMAGVRARQQALNAELARARFAIYGESVPPDASFSLRLADGIVDGYTYNGTRAPWHTTYFGMYDHYYSYVVRDAWELPPDWADKPAGLDLDVPLNLVSTNDITGGNSGSPLLNTDLELVGVIFDSNIEGLPNQYLYRDAQARAVSVDARGILEAVRDVYGADRIVAELLDQELGTP